MIDEEATRHRWHRQTIEVRRIESPAKDPCPEDRTDSPKYILNHYSTVICARVETTISSFPAGRRSSFVADLLVGKLCNGGINED